MKMKYTSSFVGCALMTLAVVACAQQAAPPTAGGEVVARIGDEVITAAEVESMVGPSLVKLRQEIYTTTVGELNAQIFERLVTAKATAEGITREEFLAKNVDAKMTEPDEGEIVKVMSMYRARLAQDDAQAREQVVQALQQQQQAKLIEALRDELFAEAGVVILLQPPRAVVAITEGTPSRGPVSAPIVLVEYTDYQCPYCTTGAAHHRCRDGAVRRPGPPRLQEPPAADAPAGAAGGRGGPVRPGPGQVLGVPRLVVPNQRTMNRESMITEAGELGMNVELFTACITDRTYQAKVDADMKEARGFGITGTPGFMINGRVLTGAQPLEAFEAVIDEELTLKGIAIPPKQETEAAEAAATSEETATE